VIVDGSELEIEGDGYNPRGKFKFIRGKRDMHLDKLLKTAALCNNASLLRGPIRVGGLFRGAVTGNEAVEWDVEGGGTEGSLLVLAARGGVWRDQIERTEKRIAELPFDSRRRRMTVFYKDEAGKVTAYTKGSPGTVLELCSHCLINGSPVPMNDVKRREILSAAGDMAGKPFRVLAFAYKPLNKETDDYSREEHGLIFTGLCGLSNDLRTDTFISLQSCLRAGYRLVMITGDHRATAGSVALEAGILSAGGTIIDGKELDGMYGEELAGQAGHADVYADVSPDQKARIIKVLKKGGHMIAAAGSGQGNMAALHEAHIGMAAYNSSLLLTGGGFSAVAAALAESRALCDNVLKYTAYVLSSGIGLAAPFFFVVPAGLSLPLLPVQIIWAGLLTGSLPAFAFAFNNAKSGIEKKSRASRRDSYLSGKLFFKSACTGLLTALCIIILFVSACNFSGSLGLARTMVLNTYIFIQLFIMLSGQIKREDCSFSHAGGRIRIAATVLPVAALQVVSSCLPLGQKLLGMIPLGVFMWGPVIAAAVLPWMVNVLFRIIKHKFRHKIAYFRV